MTKMAVQTAVDFIDLFVAVWQRVIPRAQTCPREATGKP